MPIRLFVGLAVYGNQWETDVTLVHHDRAEVVRAIEDQVDPSERGDWHWYGDDYVYLDGDENGFKILEISQADIGQPVAPVSPVAPDQSRLHPSVKPVPTEGELLAAAGKSLGEVLGQPVTIHIELGRAPLP